MSARADGFRWDLSGDVGQGSLGDVQDTDSSALAAIHYFAPVDDSRGPYELAAFLDPVSSVSASVNRQKVTIHPPIAFVVPPGASIDFTNTTDNYTIGGRYVLPASKWYAGGDYTKPKFDSPFAVDANTYRLLAGKYLGPNTSLELDMSRGHTAGEFFDSTTEIVGSSFVHVRHFRSLAYSLFGGVSQTNSHATFPSLFGGTLNSTSPRVWRYSVGAELFPTTKLGFRAGYTRVDGQSAGGHSYDVAATWFLKRNIGLELGWSQSQAGSAAPRGDGANLRFVGRF